MTDIPRTVDPQAAMTDEQKVMVIAGLFGSLSPEAQMGIVKSMMDHMSAADDDVAADGKVLPIK